MQSPTKFPGIYEVETQTQTGYLIHIERKDKKLYKLIPYGKDRDAAFQKAVREATVFCNQNPKYTRQEIMEIITKRNKSGKRGVRIREKRYKWVSDPEKETVYYDAEARWSPAPNVYKTKTFSLNVYGETDAWRLACEAREEGIKNSK